MKGYRTPSWFHSKERLKETQAKARVSKPRPARRKKGKNLSGNVDGSANP